MQDRRTFMATVAATIAGLLGSSKGHQHPVPTKVTQSEPEEYFPSENIINTWAWETSCIANTKEKVFSIIIEPNPVVCLYVEGSYDRFFAEGGKRITPIWMCGRCEISLFEELRSEWYPYIRIMADRTDYDAYIKGVDPMEPVLVINNTSDTYVRCGQGKYILNRERGLDGRTNI